MSQQTLMPVVSLDISWPDLIGLGADHMPEQQRRDRWAQWLRLCRKDDRGFAAYWTDRDGCHGCKHLRGSWCQLQGLPCTVNPILTLKHSLLGMACMGAGFEPVSNVEVSENQQ